MIVKQHYDRKKAELWDTLLEWMTRNPHFALLGAAGILCVLTATFSSSGVATLSKNSNNNNNSNKMQKKSSPSSTVSLDWNDKSPLDIRSCQSANDKNNNNNSKDRVVLCSFAKNEEPYLDEWVDYHLALGFETIYLYDNTDTHELQQWAPKKGCRLQVIHFPGFGKQLNGFKDCGRNILRQDQEYKKESSGAAGHSSNRTTWVGYFDLDEFLVLRQHENVLDFVTDHGRRHQHGGGGGGAIGVNWIIMGTAGKLIYEPYPVTKRFQYQQVNNSQEEYNNGMIKTLVQADHAYLNKMDNTHYVKMHDGYHYQDTNGHVFTPPSNPNGPTDVAAFYHFRSKSFKENIDERAQGRADKSITHISNEHWLTMAKAMDAPNGTVFDDRAWLAVKKHLPHYAAYDILAAKNYVDYRDDHI